MKELVAHDKLPPKHQEKAKLIDGVRNGTVSPQCSCESESAFTRRRRMQKELKETHDAVFAARMSWVARALPNEHPPTTYGAHRSATPRARDGSVLPVR